MLTWLYIGRHVNRHGAFFRHYGNSFDRLHPVLPCVTILLQHGIVTAQAWQ